MAQSDRTWQVRDKVIVPRINKHGTIDEIRQRDGAPEYRVVEFLSAQTVTPGQPITYEVPDEGTWHRGDDLEPYMSRGR